jgi:hypothetical protein
VVSAEEDSAFVHRIRYDLGETNSQLAGNMVNVLTFAATCVSFAVGIPAVGTIATCVLNPIELGVAGVAGDNRDYRNNNNRRFFRGDNIRNIRTSVGMCAAAQACSWGLGLLATAALPCAAPAAVAVGVGVGVAGLGLAIGKLATKLSDRIIKKRLERAVDEVESPVVGPVDYNRGLNQQRDVERHLYMQYSVMDMMLR